MPTFEEYQATIARVYGQDSKVKGTGFLVAPQYLLTCAHVVIDALGKENTDFPQQELTVDFPNFPNNLGISMVKATVVLWKPSLASEKLSPGEDIALLKLKEAIDLPIIPIIKKEKVRELDFVIWGFPEANGKATNGKILAHRLNCQRYQLQIDQDMPVIKGGFSGAPLWHSDQGIIGMTVTATPYDPKTNIGGREASAIAGSELYELWHKQGELIAILEGVPWPVVYGAYQFARHHYISTQWKTEKPKTLAEAIADLYEMQRTLKQNHQLAFVAHLLKQGKLDQDVAVTLTIWAEKHFPNFEAVKQEISQKIESQKTSESRLWIILNQYSTGDCCFIEAAHFIQNLNDYHSGAEPDSIIEVKKNPMQKAYLNKEIQTVLTSIFEQIPKYKNLIIEVFLPLGALDLTPDQWLFYEKKFNELLPLGVNFSVVLRILDRVPGYDTNYQAQDSWEKNWKNKNLQQCCQDSLICTTNQPDNIINALQDSIVSGIRSAYPPSEHQGKRKPDSLVWHEGIPFWLWVRKPLESCAEPMKYRQLLTESTLHNLPKRLRALRNNALDDPNHLAAHISFLADNPEKMPNLEPIPFQNP